MPASIFRDDANIRAYALGYSPAALQLPLGLQSNEPGARPLPAPVQSWQGELSQGGLQWKPVAPDPTRDTFALPPLDWALCLAQQGCAPADPVGFSYCSQACEAASPALPTPPDPPQGTVFVAQGEGETRTYHTTLPAALGCPDGQRQAYGDAECASVGLCPQGWPAPAPTGTTWYVEHGGTGLGTREAPFATVSEAVQSSRPGDTILIGVGDYAGPQQLQGPVTVRGRCPAETRLQSLSAMRLSGQDLVISDLRLPEVTVIDGRVRLQRVTWLDVSAALSHDAGTLTITDALAQRISGDTFVSRGGDLSMAGVVVDGTQGTGIECNARAHCNLRRTAVRNFGDPGAETPKPAVFMAGATFEMSEFVIEDGAADGLLIEDSATGTAAVGLIRNLTGSDRFGRGVTVRRDAQLDVQDLFVSRVSIGALNLSSRGIVHARDIVVLDTQSDGVAFRLQPEGARLRVDRAYVSEDRSPLLKAVKLSDCSAELTDVRYLSHSTAPAPVSLFGVQDGQAVLRRAHLTSSGPTIIEMGSTTSGSTLVLVDVRTEGGLEALRIDTQTTVQATRAHFSGILRGGIIVPRLTEGELESTFIGEDITIEMAGGDGLANQGTALEVARKGEVSIKRFVVRGPALVGVQVRRFGQLRLTDGIISGPELGLRMHVEAASDLEEALRTVTIETPRRVEMARD